MPKRYSPSQIDALLLYMVWLLYILFSTFPDRVTAHPADPGYTEGNTSVGDGVTSNANDGNVYTISFTQAMPYSWIWFILITSLIIFGRYSFSWLSPMPAWIIAINLDLSVYASC